ncbi:hypothetical protein EI94DRAFT_1713573 [Lactarius quietus]|nr:hypothetical protein EI94DRAFT_1713573 [Lactarius quietus]
MSCVSLITPSGKASPSTHMWCSAKHRMRCDPLSWHEKLQLVRGAGGGRKDILDRGGNELVCSCVGTSYGYVSSRPFRPTSATVLNMYLRLWGRENLPVRCRKHSCSDCAYRTAQLRTRDPCQSLTNSTASASLRLGSASSLSIKTGSRIWLPAVR